MRWNLTGSSLLGLWHPLTLGILLAPFLLVMALRGRGGQKREGARTWALALSFLTLYAALGSPLWDAGRFLFSADMVGEMIVAFLAAPLFLVGCPEDWLRRVAESRGGGPAVTVLVWPPVALVVFNGFFSLLHFPGVYDAVLASNVLRVLSTVVLFGTAVLMWWPVLSPLPERPALTPPMQMLYLFVNGLMLLILFALVIFAPAPIYPHYARAPRLLPGLTAQSDQQLAGVLMKAVTIIGYGLPMLRAFRRWVQRERMKEAFGLLPTPGEALPPGAHWSGPPAPLGPRRLFGGMKR